ncbi:MAG: hypothetical protein Q7S16_03615 [bacterium]|nr:hypothetical protein [bacterium]
MSNGKNGNGNGSDSRYAHVYSRKGSEHESIRALTSIVETVHVNGRATFPVVQAILNRAPNVRRIELIPQAMSKVSVQTHAFCQQHSIVLTVGHCNPNLVWKENRSPWFMRKQSFFRNLHGEAKEHWEELLILQIPVALLTARYFCLNGEEYCAQDVLAPKYGFSAGSYGINGVIFYLDKNEKVGGTAKEVAQAISRRVQKLRAPSL